MSTINHYHLPIKGGNGKIFFSREKFMDCPLGELLETAILLSFVIRTLTVKQDGFCNRVSAILLPLDKCLHHFVSTNGGIGMDQNWGSHPNFTIFMGGTKHQHMSGSSLL